MLFNEIYSRYYRTVEQILQAAQAASLTQKDLYRIVSENAFGESNLTIPDALVSGEWPLLTKAEGAADSAGGAGRGTNVYSTPLIHEPKMPLSTLEKQWMKALLGDPRIRLFLPWSDPDALMRGLEDVEPLFDQADFVYFDRYDDGDPYDDPTYIRCFRNAVAGLRSGVKLHIGFNGGKGKHHEWVCVPLRMEYSAKDDKFRLVTRSNKGGENSINVARMTDCYLKEPFTEKEKAGTSGGRSSVELMLTDERNALERAMLHFSHFEKETERVERKTYLLRIVYDQEDETELLIRIIGFGPMVRVTGPERFRELIKERLEMQMTCALH